MSKGMSISFDGIVDAQNMLKKMADLTTVKQAVADSGSELENVTIRNMGQTYRKTDYNGKRYSTGATQQSVKSVQKNGGLTVEVKPDTEYFPYVELGTRFMAAEPTLKPAVDTVYPHFLSRITKAVGGK